ncbi:REP-associated tyrosine transposase [Fusibacter tunisiensis]|uniref:REP element-mobilizing transposase RayT n=1 Tax=Fusibacter tunisiensis TaxID=1008308 RepID=A0ABS2MU70_9FIRM|nr:transposase [Fusibacter tunisiensis]MBM7562978.1 REP element-mobilizing transposase RayT [Fusibacter tunisiensis]
MPRIFRTKSQSGIYHVITRGNDRNLIFLDSKDYSMYLAILKKYQEECKFDIFAYCLMTNHIHLLIRENPECHSISQIMHRINLAFVKYYNKRYHRVGHLFQGRFTSVEVEDEDYFRTALRYIHQNPLRANATAYIDQYKWSSYNEYVLKPYFCNVDFTLNLFPDQGAKNKEAFYAYHRTFPDNAKMPKELPEANTKIKDPEAILLINALAGVTDPKIVSDFNSDRRHTIVFTLKEKYHLSNRQIARLTGINRKNVTSVKS